MNFLLATKNSGKLLELKELFVGIPFEFTSLVDHPDLQDVVEDGASFLDNAHKKALAAWMPGRWVLADDSGLCVDALSGAPGIYSARYAGEPSDSNANMIKLLEVLAATPDDRRTAHFTCTMVLLSPAKQMWSVEGRCNGVILRERRGGHGFGYDPVFYLPECGRTMAELTMEEKNRVSHRGKALRKVREILVAQITNSP
ncbi:MAG: XTP/dITP diphosphatase [Deltaproteobacteria bacterium]|nr:XTP/dITP diphosphatase [Deltaproteobacteria bacterium]